MTSDEAIRSILWTRLPESRLHLQEFEADEQAELDEHQRPFGLRCWSYLSEIFWWEVFEPALTVGDDELATRCFAVVEELIELGNPDVDEPLDIRVVEHLCHPKRRATVLRLAGPLLRTRLRRYGVG